MHLAKPNAGWLLPRCDGASQAVSAVPVAVRPCPGPMRLITLVGHMALAGSAAIADADTRVTAVRTEGTPVETNDFYHDETGLEIFGLRETTPVKVFVRRIDGSDWTREDVEDAARQLATCTRGTASVPTARLRGPVLTLRFECSLRI